MEEISARDFGKMEKAVENLGNQVGVLTAEVQGLRDDLQQRKGAKKMIYIIASCFGAISGVIGAAVKSLVTVVTQ